MQRSIWSDDRPRRRGDLPTGARGERRLEAPYVVTGAYRGPVAEAPRDDRATFALEQLKAAQAIGADRELRHDAIDLLAAADRKGWTYTWRWLGVPVIQAPEDILTLHEIIWDTRPDLVIETGIARGGSVLLYASLLELIGAGSVVGVDVDIRPQ